MRTIRRVAVLGAGTMGSRIAAHFANAGVPALLLDIALPDQFAKPGAFFTNAARALVTPGTFDGDLDGVRDCDWIVEAVTENLDVKRALFERVAARRRADAIVSTNTSGIPLASIAEGFPLEFRRNFLGTHFFNPPRYLHLVELIPGPGTDPAVLRFVSDFCDLRLGKGVVPCKDTPNFIANRIGAFFGGTAQRLMVEGDYTIEEVDALTGPLIGLPKSASFRLMDIIGLDVWAHVASNLYELIPGDPWRDRFQTPQFIRLMIERGWLGEKSGRGFYKKRQKDLYVLDWKTLEYRPVEKVRLPAIENAKNISSLPERLRMLVNSGGRAGDFLWKLLSDLLVYSAERVPEISDRIVEIDRAMRWGYAHKLGPFELWDALGVESVCARLSSVPAAVERMLASGAKSFYHPGEYFDLTAGRYQPLEERPGVLTLAGRDVVLKNAGASILDLGDGVLCLEFHGKMNALGDDQIGLVRMAIDETERNHEALIIANQGEHFSAGANLMLILLAAQDEDWDELDGAIRRFQEANLAIKYAPCPVVAAPFAMTLGGGCEVVLHAARVQASAELYMGLVETGVGLIPAAGGCKEMLLRLGDPKRAFELIGFAKVSGSAAEAREMGLLRATDCITMNPDRLVADAKAAALALAPAYVPPQPLTGISVTGEAGYALMKLGAWIAREGHHISDYDLHIAEKLAHVLSGGRHAGTVSEQHLLDLEREAFLSLCGEQKTQERIQHMLKTGKPLRN
ncbi:MAG: 3-hydroxyacyl-CoA dehydrogenase/enoyl-CoA hydratase family protein [Acidobacteriota bacterium]